MSDMTDREWLAGLKYGDEVMMTCGGREDRPVLTMVEHATKLHVIVAGRKFRRSTGSEVTDDIWGARWIERPDPDRLAACAARAEREQLTRRLARRLTLDPLPLDTLRAMWALATEADAEEARS